MRHGFLLIDKPKGPTSHDVVAQVRRSLPEKKVGHIGTLDPAATGLLVLAVGAKALKVVELFSDLPKEYTADIRFGSVSATYDREGPIEEFPRKPGVPDPDDSAVQEAIRTRFSGVVEQVPPAASAVHIGGERAYRKMRQGRDFNIPSRKVEITRCDIVSYSYPDLRLQIACGSGTYIRSLAHDLGRALRVGAYLAALRRTHVGNWSIEDAVSPEDVTWGHVIALKDVLKNHAALELTDQEFDHITHGRSIDQFCINDTIAWHQGLPVAILVQGSQGVKARKVL